MGGPVRPPGGRARAGTPGRRGPPPRRGVGGRPRRRQPPQAFPAAEAAGLGHPAGCTALAAFLSGGSLAPPKLPDVPPADHLTADCVASALQIAAVLNDPAKAPDHHRAFLDVGLDVARGKNRWKDRL